MKARIIVAAIIVLLSAACGLVIVHHSITGEWPGRIEDLFFWRTSAVGDREHAERSWSFPLRDSAAIVVDATDADIQITATDTAVAIVEMWLTGSTVDVDNYRTSARMADSGMLRVNAKATENWEDWSSGRAKIIVHAPRHTAITVTAVRGSATIGEMIGPLSAQTYGGGIRVIAGEGPMELHSTGGGVGVERHVGSGTIVAANGSVSTNMAQGALKISANGNVEVRRHFGRLTATSDGGGIIAELLAPDSVCTLNTHLGDITLRIPQDVALTVDAFTSEGSIINNLPFGEHQGTPVRGSWLQLVGGGGFPMLLRSYRGTITVGEYVDMPL